MSSCLTRATIQIRSRKQKSEMLGLCLFLILPFVPCQLEP